MPCLRYFIKEKMRQIESLKKRIKSGEWKNPTIVLS